MKRTGHLLAALSAVSLVATPMMAASVAARPLVPAEQRYMPYLAKLPLCDSPKVLDRISSRFSDTESEYWHSGLEVVSYDHVAEIGLRSTGLDFIPRRYCIAKATFNTGAISTVSYAIGEDLGIIGFPGFGVDWCFEGLDRQRAASPGCKMKRP